MRCRLLAHRQGYSRQRVSGVLVTKEDLAMKRESGATPGQSRCCVSPLMVRRHRNTHSGRKKGARGKGVGQEVKSQKTCRKR